MNFIFHVKKKASVLQHTFFAFIIVFIFSSSTVFCQKRDSVYDGKKTIVINNNKFKVYNNWINAGAGEANNFSHYGKQFALGVDYNFHVRMEYFQAGIFFTGDKFGSYNNFNYHLAYSRRYETPGFNFAYFAGLSYSTGYRKVKGIFSPDNVYDQLGFYGGIQFIKKVTYDTGLGPVLFFDVNRYQAIAGIRLDLYLSGAFKGKTR